MMRYDAFLSDCNVKMGVYLQKGRIAVAVAHAVTLHTYIVYDIKNAIACADRSGIKITRAMKIYHKNESQGRLKCNG